jgi:inward rectifier potassium channel
MSYRTDRIPMQFGAFELMSKGAVRFDLRDPYHLAVTVSWPHFFLAFLAVDVAINVVFASLYLAAAGSIANARPGSFADAFFFSIETLATVGYGVMAPASLYGHAVSAAEIVCGLVFTAIMTGLIFVRFSKPRAKILFAEDAVISHDGRPALMVRLGNGRLTLLAKATAQLTLFVMERGPDGSVYRRPHELLLVRAHEPIFALTWTLVHEIDEHGPLADHSPQRLAELDTQLLVTVEARDIATGMQMFAMNSYGFDRIRVGMRFQETLSHAPGRMIGDLTRLSRIEPDEAPASVGS